MIVCDMLLMSVWYCSHLLCCQPCLELHTQHYKDKINAHIVKFTVHQIMVNDQSLTQTQHQ